ncbi:hypothetical protein F503_03871 [Ophiostoma piceae UAMH 11346]|uniref:Uncharacterized protein n=1 Tax=Ophiostoma piceae (strain UAMH 11346) TaxID=1262450 RepID=S3C0Q8_OPHP1|nr:hypothetical protein F503_03871 [Ophiostoma piceae UAMH 11346]
MGLHTTPYGSFYVQRDLKTGEIIQVLPVQAKDTPDQLPSVGALGIDENFIESRRATFEASNVRASDSQGRLQRELATAGGRRLLETGRAVIAQRDDHSHSSHSSPSAAAYQDGDVDMAYAQAPASHSHSQYQYSSASPSSSHNQRDNRDTGDTRDKNNRTSRNSRSSSSRRGSSMNVNYTLSEDPHQQSLHMHPVRPWPESLPHEHTVNLPPFREIDLARAPSHEDEGRRHDERVSSRGTPSSITTSSSSSRSRSYHTSRSSHGGSRSSHRSNSTAFSISSMITDSEGGSTYSASEASTPTALSPIPDYYYCNTGHGYSPSPAHPGYAALPPMLSPVAGSPEPTGRCSTMVDAPPQIYTPRAPHPSKSHTSPPPPPSFSSPAPAPPSAAATKKQKTVWIIRTLEPRKMAPNGDEYDDYEPQRVKTHVETHVAS